MTERTVLIALCCVRLLHYCVESEGLRAVASLLVTSSRIWIGRVSGGVHVFFVIAGLPSPEMSEADQGMLTQCRGNDKIYKDCAP